MTIFKEWRDLEGRLIEADATRREETKGEEDAAILSRIEAFKTIENPTIETRAAFIRKLNDDFPGVSIPDEGYNIIYGWRDDDDADRDLERYAANNGGKVTPLMLQAVKASPTIINKWRADTVENNQAQISSCLLYTSPSPRDQA